MNVHLSDITPDRDNPARLLDELRQALEAEIGATQAQAATFRAEVMAGTLLGNGDSGYIYAFLLTTVLPIDRSHARRQCQAAVPHSGNG